ncbi:hypothetical protein [uncultured Caulobacter sp.]|nr:hypothetical protein [uncultured Caulobacter sp.]
MLHGQYVVSFDPGAFLLRRLLPVLLTLVLWSALIDSLRLLTGAL